ncbi:MAG: hypothetical protein V3V32_00815 [Dehalococcoidia bacterium]|jgi:hypothetical protein|nr:MAG: hypothetical protein E3J81_05155 [Dehalococcoidia bacterium]
MREAFLKRLFSKVNCGVCGQKYDVSNIKILDQEDGLWVLSVYCSSCGTQGLIAAVVQEGNITEVITDLTEAERERFDDSEVVGVDDVLEMHNFLKEFDGDFANLFSEK